MCQYVVIENVVCDIYEGSINSGGAKRQFVVKMKSLPFDQEQLIDLLKKILIKKDHEKSYLVYLINSELPVCLIEKQYIQDHEFVETYYPEFLI